MLLQDRLKNYRLILASASPRRRELLASCDIDFTLAEKFECEECYPADLEAERVAEYLSQLKSEAYPQALTEGDILLTADTVVIAGGEILGKPKDRADAERILQTLSGATHKVVTGVTLRTTTQRISFSAESLVTFRLLENEEIAYYIEKYHPMDKAGAYGIQEWIGYVGIERIEGSFYNVMGLPVQRLYVELQRLIKNL
ncbi:MAG: septum formation protein Maf [Rikenellaceae bacterium]|nr:septum formation protein Maf [Rikenellaceae bacterium]